VTITVKPFQPFGSRVGKDTVLGLHFDYDAGLVQVLKDGLQALRRFYQGFPQPGGWLPQHGCWFVEREVWPAVQGVLERAGHDVVEQEVDRD
jgi:hypothetical protein